MGKGSWVSDVGDGTNRHCRVGSCLRRNDGEGCGNDERGVAWVIGVCAVGGDGSGLSTPHLTSPLEGGRDELGRREEGRGCGGAWMQGFLPAQE